MSDQPKALRLAEIMEQKAKGQKNCTGDYWGDAFCCEAAAELRRLHAENEALQNTRHYEAPRGFVLNPDYLVLELQAERYALLKALQWLDRWLGHKPMTECTAKIKAAIEAARGSR